METPLHVAARNGKTEVVTFLISNGADPNAVNPLLPVDEYTRH